MLPAVGGHLVFKRLESHPKTDLIGNCSHRSFGSPVAQRNASSSLVNGTVLIHHVQLRIGASTHASPERRWPTYLDLSLCGGCHWCSQFEQMHQGPCQD
jgi:hypothetical protein